MAKETRTNLLVVSYDGAQRNLLDVFAVSSSEVANVLNEFIEAVNHPQKVGMEYGLSGDESVCARLMDMIDEGKISGSMLLLFATTHIQNMLMQQRIASMLGNAIEDMIKEGGFGELDDGEPPEDDDHD